MKKNYIKPSLLSETFVTENIMNGVTALSAMNSSLWSISSGQSFQGIQFNSAQGGNTIHTINFSEFQPKN